MILNMLLNSKCFAILRIELINKADSSYSKGELMIHIVLFPLIYIVLDNRCFICFDI